MSNIGFKIQHAADAARLPRLTSTEVRDSFLLTDLFRAGAAELVWTDLDRAVVGGIVPTTAPVTLDAPKELRTPHFTARRELGVLNLGGDGWIAVDNERFPMAARDGLYVGCGTHALQFGSADAAAPARFYLVSYPAHQAFPTRHARFAEAQPVVLGSTREANRRTIYKYIHEAGIRSCQLVMGMTLLEEGSVWNTMPPHVHLRRSEIYLYFDMPANARVLHLLGTSQETKHVWVGNEQAVLSPPWSIHSGVGTQRYGFVWAMGGENQEFSDMDGIAVADLR